MSCSEDGTCSSCAVGYSITGKGTGCMLPIPNCQTDPINYIKDQNGNWFCSKCNKGMTWKDG